MKIPFDIKYRPQIESGEYDVETRDGRPVRIICWDRKYGYPICGLAYEKATGRENYVNAFENGMTAFNRLQETNDDIFIITPEPFEQALETFLMNADASEQTFHENVKKYANKLLELAKKEIAKSHEHDVYIPEDTYHEQLKKQWEDGYDKGKAEVLNGLPRWKVADRDIISNTIDFAVPYMNDGGDHADWVEVIVTNVVHKGKNYFEISELEKLPGFNG